MDCGEFNETVHSFSLKNFAPLPKDVAWTSEPAFASKKGHMKKITESHFAFKCPMNWDEMNPSANGRFCGKCQKEVFDLTNCSIDEVIALQRKHGAICGSITIAAVAISLSTAACQNGQIPVTECHAKASGDFPYTKVAGGILPPHKLEKHREP